MNNKFCVKCGHANPAISNGIAVKFCAKCGHDMSSTTSFATQRPTQRKPQQNPFSIELEENANTDFAMQVFSMLSQVNALSMESLKTAAVAEAEAVQEARKQSDRAYKGTFEKKLGGYIH